jgi:hypothetical protein
MLHKIQFGTDFRNNLDLKLSRNYINSKVMDFIQYVIVHTTHDDKDIKQPTCLYVLYNEGSTLEERRN